MSTLHMLTTVDNPFNPFTQWDEWFAYDERKGYHTAGLLARITRTNDELSEANQDQAIEDAIDECIKYNVIGLLRKVSIDEADKLIANQRRVVVSD